MRAMLMVVAVLVIGCGDDGDAPEIDPRDTNGDGMVFTGTDGRECTECTVVCVDHGGFVSHDCYAPDGRLVTVEDHGAIGFSCSTSTRIEDYDGLRAWCRDGACSRPRCMRDGAPLPTDREFAICVVAAPLPVPDGSVATACE